MAEPEQPQLYLITPPDIELSSFPNRLEAILDAHPVACLRLSLATRDEDRIARAADAMRELAHPRDIAIVLDEHVQLSQRLGLDGVHLTGSRGVRDARKVLGPDAIVGVHAGTSRHEGLTAGEAGADYVAFGPVGATALGDGRVAERDLFAWWSEMIEVPVVAEGAIGVETVAELTDITDFFALGEEIWSSEDPVEALSRLTSRF